ncbi:MAG: response regulator [Bdellovibrionales bacterium]|nr:response regulator [Bdellovibrionales bacterium]
MRRILLVDDNENVIQSLKRQLRGKFEILSALRGGEALSLLESYSDIAVVVSDMRMPEMDGVEFLKRARKVSPDTTRVMLTGNVDQTTAVLAVNEGGVFRFLNKPIDPAAILQTLEESIELYEMRIAEKELLNDTVKGVAELLSELMSFVDPKLYGVASTLRLNIREVAKQLNIVNPWELELAALLSPIGLLALPSELRVKHFKGEALSSEEQDALDRHPESAYGFLRSIPRLQNVADMVRYQNKNIDGSGFPLDDVRGEEIPLGARVLRVLNSLPSEMLTQEEQLAMLDSIRSRGGNEFDAEACEAVVAALRPRASIVENVESLEKSVPEEVQEESAPISEESAEKRTFSKPVEILVKDLEVGQILVKEVRTQSGVLLLQPGRQVTEANLQRLKNYHRFSGIREPLVVVTMVEE